jgi:hypothetical protein
MRDTLFAVGLGVVLSCGPGSTSGPRQPGAVTASRVVFWRISSSELAFGEMCSDSMSFRSQFAPLGFNDSTYLSYRVSTDGKSADSLTCESLEARSCQVTDGGIRYAVQGADLIGSRVLGAEVVGSTCRLTLDEMWVVSDFGPTTAVTISSALGLSQADGGGSACASVDESLRVNSPNRKGVVGCVLAYSLGGTFTEPR